MSFFSKFKGELDRLFHNAPFWVHASLAIVNFAAPFVVSLETVYAPEAVPLTLPILARIKAGLATVSVLAGDGNNPVTLSYELNALQANLQSLLAVGGVNDPAMVQKVTATVNLLVGEIQAIQAALPVGTQPSTNTAQLGPAQLGPVQASA